MTNNPPKPKRGGEHPIYGIFIGGSELDNTYNLTGIDTIGSLDRDGDLKL